MPETTDFGYQEIPKNEKNQRVGQVFSSVASHYDVMNDAMSLGVHRLWKRFTIDFCKIRQGETVIDVAGGSGDLTQRFAQLVGKTGHVVLTDINADMLHVGRTRLLNAGLTDVTYVQANAEALPFPDNTADCITIAFGLRNVTDKMAALSSMRRTLKPGGRLIILEFSHPTWPGLQRVYDAYSFHVLPQLGQWIAGDADSYRYLVESIRKHPHQEQLLALMQEAGLKACDHHNLSGGIVAVHRGYK